MYLHEVPWNQPHVCSFVHVFRDDPEDGRSCLLLRYSTTRSCSDLRAPGAGVGLGVQPSRPCSTAPRPATGRAPVSFGIEVACSSPDHCSHLAAVRAGPATRRVAVAVVNLISETLRQVSPKPAIYPPRILPFSTCLSVHGMKQKEGKKQCLCSWWIRQVSEPSVNSIPSLGNMPVIVLDSKGMPEK